MSNKNLILFTCLILISGAAYSSSTVYKAFTNTSENSSANNFNDKFIYRFYAGLTGGFGWTTWGGLVPPVNKQNIAINMSTPIHVEEGGGLWGAFAGYELLPNFALELSYMHYPNAQITFDSFSIFTLDHDGSCGFTSRTETLSLMAKVMLIIPKTTIRLFSSLGAAEVHRNDQLQDHYRTTPTFGAGFNYNFTPHIMAELGANYVAGFGQSELDPTQDYFPFLYSVFLRLGVRF